MYCIVNSTYTSKVTRETSVLQGCFAAYVGNYWPFGTAYQSHIEESSYYAKCKRKSDVKR